MDEFDLYLPLRTLEEAEHLKWMVVAWVEGFREIPDEDRTDDDRDTEIDAQVILARLDMEMEEVRSSGG